MLHITHSIIKEFKVFYSPHELDIEDMINSVFDSSFLTMLNKYCPKLV